MAPGSAGAHEQFGMTLAILTDWQYAREQLSLAIAANPEDSKAFAFRALCEARLGLPSDAEQDARTALRLDPSSPVARQVLAAHGR